MTLMKSVALFILAGLAEIGGGYLVWQWVRGFKPAYFALLGGVLLVVYGFIPPLQPTHFGRAYAAYGGVFIILSIIWSGVLDQVTPDRFDVLGALLCLIGVAIMMYAPR